MGSDAERLEQVIALYRQGLFLQAYAAADSLGPLEQWRGAEARIWAGRLGYALGSPRLCRVLHQLAWRENPADPLAQYFYALGLFQRRGPWAAWELVERIGSMAGAPSTVVADWCALRAHLAATLRDFQQADWWMAEALDLEPERPWIWMERAAVLEAEDRHEEALQAACRARQLQPWYASAVQAMAHYLMQTNRDREALELLSAAAGRLECGSVVAQLAGLETELGLFAEARAHLEELPQLMPLLDREKKRCQWLDMRRAEAAYYCGDREEAIRLAEAVDEPFYRQFAERLKGDTDGHRRVLLAVGFVRQHHVTCAPATLAALSRFWAKPADHLEVAEQICYDGTPGHSQRRWAEENGFVVREFRVTWESAVALIDRNIPFALSTVMPGIAHLQAIIGYDTARRSLLIRDPNQRHFTEFDADKMFEQLRSSGPGGMAMVPREQAELFQGLELPDAQQYDEHYRIQRALAVHDRKTAAVIYGRMCLADAEHPLTIRARGTLANYDADPVSLLQMAERLLAKFPDDANLLVLKLNCLRELGRREQRLELLEEVCAKPGSDALFSGRYAGELLEDARMHGKAELLVRAALRERPTDGVHFQLLADLAWQRGQQKDALRLYRIAACLDDRDEGRAKAYFIAARHCRETHTAMQWLQDRFVRFGRLSGWPAHTLSWAHEQLEQTEEAFGVVREALALRPNDGELLLYAADLHARYGKRLEAAEHLERAREDSHRTNWLRTAANLALYQADFETALKYARQVVEAEPLARDANQQLAQMLANLQGSDAAAEHFRRAVERFPSSYSLRVLLIEWLGEGDAAEAETAVRELLQTHPLDPWARRQLAIELVRQRKWDEALAEVELAEQLDPTSPTVYLVRGRCQEGQGQTAKARRHYREAIHISVDFEAAVAALMATCQTKADREEQLKFVYEELVRQVIFGDGLLCYREYALATVEPESLLVMLREALEARPDLWHAHAAVVRQLAELGRIDESLATAKAAVQRFALLPRMWLELALVHRARKDVPGEIEALRQALAINPSWSEAAQQLAEAHRRGGDLAQAQAVLEQAVAREPRNPPNRAMLADVLWQLDQRDVAIERMTQVTRMEPGYAWAWSRLERWASELKRPEVALDPARQLTQTRPNEARSWFVLGRMLRDLGRWEEALEALDRSIDLSPRQAEAHDIRADCLAELRRFDEAQQACRPEAFGEEPPLELQARAADVEARRGEIREAIAQMRKIVEQDPDYFWAWARLADWYDHLKDNRGYLQAAEQMVRIAPQTAACWGYRGDAQMRLGYDDKAESDLRHALELAPDYAFAATALFDLKLRYRDLTAARQYLDALRPHVSKAVALAHGVRLASAAVDRDSAIGQFEELCRGPIEDPGTLGMAVNALLEHAWESRAERLMFRQMLNPSTDPNVAIVWGDLCARRKWFLFAVVRLIRLRCQGDFWALASQRFLEQVAKAGHTGWFAIYVFCCRRRLWSDNRTWAIIGNYYFERVRYRRAARWMSDWRNRQNIGPAILFPLMISLWSLGRRRDATRVAEHALTLPPDHVTPYHRLWLAVNDVFSGSADRAVERLRDISPQMLNDYYQAVFRLIEATASTITSPDPLPYPAAIRRLVEAKSAISRPLQQSLLIREVYCDCRQQLARRYGRRLATRVWRFWARWNRVLYSSLS